MAIAFNIFIFGSSPNLVADDCSECSSTTWTSEPSTTFNIGDCNFTINYESRQCDDSLGTNRELKISSIQKLNPACDTISSAQIYNRSLKYLLYTYYQTFDTLNYYDTTKVAFVSAPCLQEADMSGLIEFCSTTYCNRVEYNLTGFSEFTELVGTHTYTSNYMPPTMPCGAVMPCGTDMQFVYNIPPGPLHFQLYSDPLANEDCDDPCYWKLNGNSNVDDVYHFLGTINYEDLNFKTHNKNRMKITRDGKVGIKTKKPLGLLDINFATWGGGHPNPELLGEASYPRMIFDVEGHDNIYQNFIMATGGTSGCDADNKIYSVYHWQINSNRGNYHDDDNNVVTYGPLNINFAPSNYCFDPLVGIDNDLLETKFTFAREGSPAEGHFGINTTTPRDNLHVIGNMRINPENTGNALKASALTGTHSDYLLAVEGKIVAEEIIVTESNWADHVFYPNYKLTSLLELESKIKELGHLPGMPSEADVKENGYSVNEMQVKMLEKIEELTLYMIELKKENEKLKTQISQISQIEGIRK